MPWIGSHAHFIKANPLGNIYLATFVFWGFLHTFWELVKTSGAFNFSEILVDR